MTGLKGASVWKEKDSGQLWNTKHSLGAARLVVLHFTLRRCWAVLETEGKTLHLQRDCSSLKAQMVVSNF